MIKFLNEDVIGRKAITAVYKELDMLRIEFVGADEKIKDMQEELGLARQKLKEQGEGQHFFRRGYHG